jgi:hypothetical protein
VSHHDPIVHTDRIEFEWNPTGLPYRLFHDSAELLQMYVTRDDVDVRIADCNEWLVKITLAPDMAGGPK